MNCWDIILSVGLAVLLALALRQCVRNHKKGGCSGCSGDCGACLRLQRQIEKGRGGQD